MTKAQSRDFQRAKVYHAERIFAEYLEQGSPEAIIGDSTLVLPPEAKFSTPETVQAYVNRVLTHPPVIEKYGGTTVSVRRRKGETKAHYSPLRQEIAVPDTKSALREIVILHELAHHFDTGPESGHGPRFASTFLTLVGLVMGSEAELLLHILFCDGGVQVS